MNSFSVQQVKLLHFFDVNCIDIKVLFVVYEKATVFCKFLALTSILSALSDYNTKSVFPHSTSNAVNFGTMAKIVDYMKVM